MGRHREKLLKKMQQERQKFWDEQRAQNLARRVLIINQDQLVIAYGDGWNTDQSIKINVQDFDKLKKIINLIDIQKRTTTKIVEKTEVEYVPIFKWADKNEK